MCTIFAGLMAQADGNTLWTESLKEAALQRNGLGMIRNISKNRGMAMWGRKRHTLPEMEKRKSAPALGNLETCTCTHLLSRMLSKVHWSFLKKGWHLISSTPVRPRRTFLHTATDCEQSLNTKHTPLVPYTHHHHVIPNTQPIDEWPLGPDHTDQHGEPHDHWWTLEPPLTQDNVDPGGEREWRQQHQSVGANINNSDRLKHDC